MKKFKLIDMVGRTYLQYAQTRKEAVDKVKMFYGVYAQIID